MNLRWIRFLCIEIYKSIYILNLNFTKKVFEKKKNNRVVRKTYKISFNIPWTNQVTFGTNNLKSYGRKIWNALPFNIKTAENFSVFETLMKK